MCLLVPSCSVQASSCWHSWLLLAAEKEEQDPAAVFALFESENDLQLIFADKRDIGDFMLGDRGRGPPWRSLPARWRVEHRLLRGLLPARWRVEHTSPFANGLRSSGSRPASSEALWSLLRLLPARRRVELPPRSLRVEATASGHPWATAPYAFAVSGCGPGLCGGTGRWRSHRRPPDSSRPFRACLGPMPSATGAPLGAAVFGGSVRGGWAISRGGPASPHPHRSRHLWSTVAVPGGKTVSSVPPWVGFAHAVRKRRQGRGV